MASMVYRNMTSDDSPMLIKKNITIDGNGTAKVRIADRTTAAALKIS